MAHDVARKLNMRPNDILDNWGCAELLVAYGQYANEDAYKNWLEWDHMYGSRKDTKPPKPKKYVVEFVDG